MPLSKDTPISTWIHDFVKSTNPKFSGKSSEERRRMAIAAYYAKQKSESVESEESILIEDLNDLDEALLSQDHPLFKVAKAASTHQDVHSVKHAGDSSNGKYAHLEVRIKDRTNPNAVRIKKMVVHKETGEAQKSTLGQGLMDVRHLDKASEDYENYNTILEYRIKNSHAEDMQAAMEAGKKACEENKECDPDQCPTLYSIICKHADITHDLKVHFKNAWKRGYVSDNTIGKAKELDDSFEISDVDFLNEASDLTKILNPFAKSKSTNNRKHFDSLMHIRRIQHVGHLNNDPKFTVEKKGDMEIHSVHGANGKLVVGVWNNLKDEGRYIKVTHQRGRDEKMTTENVNEETSLDELSQATLTSYGKKAGSEKTNAEKISNDPNAGKRMQTAASDILKRRKAGLDRLEKKAEKVTVTEETNVEEVVNVDEMCGEDKKSSRFQKIAKESVEKRLSKSDKE